MSTETLPVFSVLRLIRDAHSTRKAERQLLDALGLRCNPKKKYLCWPSIASSRLTPAWIR